MKILAILFSFSVLLLSSLAHSTPIRCQYLFHSEDRLTRAVKQFQNSQTDTTSLRQEVKFVVKTKDLDTYLPNLASYFGSRFKNRDKAAAGFANITSTRYMTVGKFIQNFKRLSAKVRFRKYYVRELSDTNWKNLTVHSELKDRSWLELKIQHPEFDNVVFKPRLKILDKDIDKLITEKYFDYKEGVIQRLHEINPGKEADIAKFASYFDALYTTPAMRVENMLAKTEYERTSYSIKLKNPSQANETVDIQITLDRSIRLTRLRDGSTFNVYKPDETVVEVKVPVAYSKLSEADIVAIPELIEIKKLIEMLNQQHVMDYPKNRGKMSKIDKKNDMQNDSDLDWD